MNKIGVNLLLNSGVSGEDLIKFLSHLGFEAAFTGVLEEREEQENIANLLSKYSIEYEFLHAPSKGINNIWLENEEGEAVLTILKGSLERCREVGVGKLVVHLSSGDDAPPISDIGMNRFKRLVDFSDKIGVQIAFENQRKMGNLAWAVESFPSAGFCYDTGHENCFTNGKRFMPLLGDRLVCTHIHDNFGEHNRDLHMLPFDGNVDFEGVVKELKRVDYKGSLMLEINPKQCDKYGVSNPYGKMELFDYLTVASIRIKKIRDMWK
jgi:sugar phosphate isomerase/epimerase